MFYDEIAAFQENNLRPVLERILRLVQLHLWGDVDDANRPTYGAPPWTMPSTSHDTRHEGGMTRPIILGEIVHPDTPSERVPVVFHEGRQKTSHPASKSWGLRHIEFRHGRELRDLGFKAALEFAHHILAKRNGEVIKATRNERNLTITGKGSPNLFEALHLMKEEGYYRITTAYPLTKKMGEDKTRSRGFQSIPLTGRNGLAPTVFPATPNNRTETHGTGGFTPCRALDAKTVMIICQDANSVTSLKVILGKLRKKLPEFRPIG